MRICHNLLLSAPICLACPDLGEATSTSPSARRTRISLMWGLGGTSMLWFQSAPTWAAPPTSSQPMRFTLPLPSRGVHRVAARTAPGDVGGKPCFWAWLSHATSLRIKYMRTHSEAPLGRGARGWPTASLWHASPGSPYGRLAFVHTSCGFMNLHSTRCRIQEPHSTLANRTPRIRALQTAEGSAGRR
jgi:hypothetical protein